MTRDARRWLVPVALALLVAFAGCSGSGGGDAGGAATMSGDAADMDAQATAAEGGDDSAVRQQDSATGERALIRNGTVTLDVDDYESTRSNLTREVRGLGGYVSDTDERVHTRDNESWTDGELVVRVPKENFSTLVNRTKRAGEVRRATTSTTDVTDQLVDLDARLENLQSQRAQLRELYDEANETETVLQIQERLSEVQTEIEQIEAQREALRDRVAYSTLTVRLNENPPETTDTRDVDRWYDTGLISAFVSSLHGVVVAARALAVGAAYAAPYLLAFGVPVVGAVAFWRRRRRSTSVPEVSEPAQMDAGDDGASESESE
ncbi:DUF4349 domain-containing protein [Halorussus halobius]|uniref:DUF4349 domain-containing protein n=1 Tax=Halorussus halobius TaxID=1710537 RepID=UPI0010933271|nr:DUF4349 domain-containing protein [Halorussus halobius]